MNKYLNFRVTASVCLFSAILAFSCAKDTSPTVTKSWSNVLLKSSYETRAITGRTDSGYVTLTLYSDNSLKYSISMYNVAGGDMLTGAHVHFGDPASTGAVIIDFNPVWSNNNASGTITGLRSGQVDTLLHQPVYFNVHSMMASAVGLAVARGQLDKTIQFAANVALSGSNQVPSVSTMAIGTGVLRLTTDKILYSNVSVTALESGDALTMAHIHKGAAGTNGDVRVVLCNSATDFGMSKATGVLPDSIVTMLTSAPMYVNVHSVNHAAGVIRGQIR